jgi:hypothetical protein
VNGPIKTGWLIAILAVVAIWMGWMLDLYPGATP